MNFDFTEIINSIVEEQVLFIPGCKRVTPEKFNVRCFYCGDSKTHLHKKRGWVYLSIINGPSYYCFNCGHSSKGSTLAADMMGTDVGDVRRMISSKIRDSKNLVSAIDIAEEIEPVIAPVVESLEVPWYWVDPNSDCKHLLTGRRILEAPFIPKDLRFYFCKSTKRLVIPWNIYGKMDTFQTRALYADQDIKYKFNYGGDKGIFGLDSIDMSVPYIFTHEGVFDSIFMVNSVACGGIAPNNKQLETIITKYPTHKLVFFLDNPWKDASSKEYIIKLGSTHPDQLVFLWNKNNQYKDINDDVICSNNINKYVDVNNLDGVICTARKAKLALLFNKML